MTAITLVVTISQRASTCCIKCQIRQSRQTPQRTQILYLSLTTEIGGAVHDDMFNDKEAHNILKKRFETIHIAISQIDRHIQSQIGLCLRKMI